MKKENKTLIGLDWGQKRIGVALGHTETGLASPWRTISGQAELQDLINREKPDLAVIGDPRRLGGQEQNQPGFSDFVVFVKSLVPVVLIDERLSSKAADSLPGDKKTKSGRDAIAAMLILQSYLDNMET